MFEITSKVPVAASIHPGCFMEALVKDDKSMGGGTKEYALWDASFEGNLGKVMYSYMDECPLPHLCI